MVWCLEPRDALAVDPLVCGMASQPVLIGAHGGTVHQLKASDGELFQVCFQGLCLYCDSLHAGAAHLRRLERRSVSRSEAA
jgi:hypothetical protein